MRPERDIPHIDLETLPRMPFWVTSARAETFEDVAFLSGAAFDGRSARHYNRHSATGLIIRLRVAGFVSAVDMSRRSDVVLCRSPEAYKPISKTWPMPRQSLNVAEQA